MDDGTSQRTRRQPGGEPFWATVWRRTGGAGAGDGRPPSWREMGGQAALALLVHALVTWRTVMPGRDGATYLWMAERVAAGDVGGAFATVFHPLYPLLTGGVLALWPHGSPMLVGQIVAGVCAALAVVPLQAMTAHQFGLRAGRLAAVFYAFGLWFSRYPAECHSEGCFYLAVAGWAWALLGARVRPVSAGVAAALAYWARPEGLLLIGLGWLRLRRRNRSDGRRLLLAGVLTAASMPLAYAVLGAGFTLTPKAAFNYEAGVGGAVHPLLHYLRNAVAVPGTAFEAIGYVMFPLAILGCVLELRRSERWRLQASSWLVLPLLLQMLIVPALRSHARFLSGFGLLLLPLAAMACVRLLDGRPLRAWGIVIGLVLLPDVARLPLLRGEDRRVERYLGEWLRPRLRPGDFIVTEMPRLEYFAGLKPGPPRAVLREELLLAIRAPGSRFVVLVEPRSGISAVDLIQLGLRPVSLPKDMTALADERQLLVYERS